MTATRSGGFSTPMRRFAAIGLAVVIGACGGGSTPTPDPNSGSMSSRDSAANPTPQVQASPVGATQASQRKRALAVPAGAVAMAAIAAGTAERHSVALKSDGSVWAWGTNLEGELGNNSVSSPNPVPGRVVDLGDPGGFLTGVTTIAAGVYQSFALKTGGSVWAWGRNDYGQLGNNNVDGSGLGFDSWVPIQAVDPGAPGGLLTGVIAITASLDFHAGEFS